ncbi:expressed unknown protein [Seminavis robusta]|uniref:Uncharacterized protein n=1 Tax=Seminavis robusta TaxID=568900 RepID=A0A9N8EHB1_9STRA|nr:expressed unknown protein [Seminavis robusta]|eukprot:Sro949_g223620.1 n/a (736) ;mRNA; f:5306-7513
MAAVSLRSPTIPDEETVRWLSRPFDEDNWNPSIAPSEVDEKEKSESTKVKRMSGGSSEPPKRNSGSKSKDKRSKSPKRNSGGQTSAKNPTTCRRVTRTKSASARVVSSGGPSSIRKGSVAKSKSPKRSKSGGNAQESPSAKNKSPKRSTSIGDVDRSRSKSTERGRLILPHHDESRDQDSDDASIDLETITSPSSPSDSSPERGSRRHQICSHASLESFGHDSSSSSRRSNRYDHRHNRSALDIHSGHHDKPRRQAISTRKHSEAKSLRSHSRDKSDLSSSSHHKKSHRTSSRDSLLGGSSHHKRASGSKSRSKSPMKERTKNLEERRPSVRQSRSKSPMREHLKGSNDRRPSIRQGRDRSKSPMRDHAKGNDDRRPSLRQGRPKSPATEQLKSNGDHRPALYRVPSRSYSDLGKDLALQRMQGSRKLSAVIGVDRRAMMTRSQSERSNSSSVQENVQPNARPAAIDRRSLMKRTQSQGGCVADSTLLRPKPQPAVRIPRSERRGRRNTIRKCNSFGQGERNSDDERTERTGAAKVQELGRRPTRRTISASSSSENGMPTLRRVMSTGQRGRNTANGGFAKLQLSKALESHGSSKFDDAYGATLKAYDPVQRWSGSDHSKFDEAYDTTMRSFSPARQRDDSANKSPESLLSEKVQRMKELRTTNDWGSSSSKFSDLDDEEEEGPETWMKDFNSFFRTGGFTATRKADNETGGNKQDNWMKEIPVLFRTAGSAKTA